MESEERVQPCTGIKILGKDPASFQKLLAFGFIELLIDSLETEKQALSSSFKTVPAVLLLKRRRKLANNNFESYRGSVLLKKLFDVTSEGEFWLCVRASQK